MYGFDALFAHCFKDWPGPDEAMSSWSLHKFQSRKTWATEYAKRHDLPMPLIPEY